MKTTLKKIAVILLCTLFTYCGDDDNNPDDSQNGCPDLISQPAQGNFRGVDFTIQGGFYKDFSFGGPARNRCEIYVKPRTGGDCAFPQFDGTQDLILFEIGELEAQTINFEDTSGSDTLNFNRIENGNSTSVELAECGTVTITSFDSTTGELSGTIVARGQDGSEINGNFTLQFCDI